VVLKILLTAALVVIWAFLCYVVSSMYGMAVAGLDEDDHKRAIRWLSIKANLWLLLFTLVALFVAAILWGWVSL
jgi:hypothetical protein